MKNKTEFYEAVETWAKGVDSISTHLWEARKQAIREGKYPHLESAINGSLRIRFGDLKKLERKP